MNKEQLRAERKAERVANRAKRKKLREERIGKRPVAKKRRSKGLVEVGGTPAPECKAKIATYGNIWTRQLRMDEGEVKTGHKHEFDHLHHLVNGKVQIRVYDKQNRDKVIFQKVYDATNDEQGRPVDAWIKVPKEHFHDIVALTDGVLGYCLQAVANEEGNVVATDYANDKDWMDEVAEFEAQNGQADETLK